MVDEASGAAGALGRRFWTLWSAFSTSNLGDGLMLVTFPLLSVSLTDDARLIAVVAAAQFLPFLVVGLPAGVLIDRLDRRKLAMAAQGLRVAALLGVAALVSTGDASIAWLAVLAFVVGTGEVLIDGGLPAVVRDVVDDAQLETANSRLRASETVTNNFVGPPVGAALFLLDPAAPVLGAIALYIGGIGLLSTLPGRFVAEPDPDGAESVSGQIREGLTYVWNHPVLRPLAFAVAAFSFAGNATTAVFVVLALERFGLSEFEYGLLLTADSVASFTMAFFVTRLVRRTSHGWSMRLSVACYVIQALVLGTVTLVPLAVAAVIFGGISDPTWNVISATVRQRLVEDRIFGRMMTAYLFIAWSLQPFGALLGGVIAEAIGVQWVFVMAAVIVGSLLVFARPLFRRIDEAMRPAS